MSPALYSRQQQVPVVVVDQNNWWYTRNALIVKWSILGGIFLFFFAWFFGGYIHARMRIRKGLQPLWYHRFLVPEAYRPPPPGPQNSYTFYRMDTGNMMESQPPVYNPNAPLPPAYRGDGAAKVDPNLAYDMPPSGEPPAAPAAPVAGPAAVPAGELPPREPKKAGVMQKLNPFSR